MVIVESNCRKLAQPLGTLSGIPAPRKRLRDRFGGSVDTIGNGMDETALHLEAPGAWWPWLRHTVVGWRANGSTTAQGSDRQPNRPDPARRFNARSHAARAWRASKAEALNPAFLYPPDEDSGRSRSAPSTGVFLLSASLQDFCAPSATKSAFVRCRQAAYSSTHHPAVSVRTDAVLTTSTHGL